MTNQSNVGEDVEMADAENATSSETEKIDKGKSNTNQSQEDIIPFMDTFWILADESVEKRANAAKSLLIHCFSSDNNSVKDAAYAFRRLLDGLNSGRACARQGFASCLSSLLSIISADEEKKDALVKELSLENVEQETVGFHEFVRKELLDRTSDSPLGSNDNSFSKNKNKKGSERRDHAFGRLFGILALCRSGILQEAPQEVLNGYMRDIIDLLLWRNWMRESCAHAIVEFIESLISSSASTSKRKAKTAVEVVLIPELLQQEVASEVTSPEGIGISLYIERVFNIFVFKGKRSALLTSDEGLIEKLCLSLAKTASATSIIANHSQKKTEQRQHLAWNQIWKLFSTSNRKNQIELLSFIFSQFVEKHLLSENNSTAERRTLALSLVMIYLSDAKQNCRDDSLFTAIERHVLSPAIVQKLFLHTISATKGHILKDMARYVLGVIVNTAMSKNKSVEVDVKVQNESSSYYTTLIKSFIKAEPKFDSKTKSDSVSGMIMFLNKHEMNEIIDFLQDLMLRECRDGTRVEYIEGILDLLSSSTKLILNNTNFGDDASVVASIRNRVLSFFMVGAFFNCKDLQKPKNPGKETSEMKIEEKVLIDARRIQKEVVDEKTDLIPYRFRRTMSTRFFTLLSDFILAPQLHKIEAPESELSPQRMNKAENTLKVLNLVMDYWKVLENNLATLHSPISGKDKSDEEIGIEEIRIHTTQLLKMANEYLCREKKSNSAEDGKSRVIIGCGALLVSLFIQLLRCGSSVTDNNEIQDDDEQDEEEEEENIEELMKDLIHAKDLIVNKLDGIGKIESDEDDDTNPLALVADVCLSTLAVFDQSKSSGRSTRVLRETSKMAWSGCLITAASSGGKLVIDRSVMEVILDAICDIDTSSGEDEEMEDADDIDDDDDGGVFTSATAAGLEIEEDAENELRNIENSDSTDNDANDVEINSEQLQDLLLDDNMDESENEGDFELEHHAGADAALAQLIKLKRDTRKKAKEEKERMENAHRLRCFVLVETMFGGRNDSSVFQSGGVILMSLLPILKTRRKLEQEVNHTKNMVKSALVEEKKSLLERLTTLLKNKICKTKVSSQEKVEDIKMLAIELLEEAKKGGSINHCSCCSHAILLLVKYIEDFNEKCHFVEEIYAGALEDWSTKRSTKLHTNLFDDIILRFPIISRQALVSPIIKAVKEGRNTFLKTESLRLLSELYNVNDASSSGDTADRSDLSKLQTSTTESVKVINEVLKDEEVSKAKRIRDIVNACERLVAFCTNKCTTFAKIHPLWVNLDTMSSQLVQVGEKTGSENIKKICTKLREDIARNHKRISEIEGKSVEINNTVSAKAKKSKKKSSKKKSKKK